MSAPVQVGPSPHGGGPARPIRQAPPTEEQLLILIARAERKGALSHVEGDRLREGIHYLASSQPAQIASLRKRLDSAYATARRWKQIAADRRGTTAPEAVVTVDLEASTALRRVTELATRWTHIPAKRQAGASVLAVISNRDDDD